VFLENPRGMRDPVVRSQRVKMLQLSRIAPLREWAARITVTTGKLLPEFDPADGGLDSRVLILHGWISSSARVMADGSGDGPDFLSVDNDSDTAEFMWRLRSETGLLQGTAMHWRVVPWYLDDPHAISRADIRDGSAYLMELLYLLPKLDTVILCGDLPRQAWAEFIAPLTSQFAVIETVDAYAAAASPVVAEELRAAFEGAARRTF